LVPGVMDGPDLAPEVAKMEGLSGEWEDMDYRGIVDYMIGIVPSFEKWTTGICTIRVRSERRKSRSRFCKLTLVFDISVPNSTSLGTLFLRLRSEEVW